MQLEHRRPQAAIDTLSTLLIRVCPEMKKPRGGTAMTSNAVVREWFKANGPAAASVLLHTGAHRIRLTQSALGFLQCLLEFGLKIGTVRSRFG